MNIELAHKQDLPQILELQKKCYLQEAIIYNNYKIPPLIQTIKSINTDFEYQTFLKIEVKGKIIGSVRGCVENSKCKIGRLIVHEDFQNQGLGKKLMKEIEHQFEMVNKFELFTGHKSIKNLSLYNKLDYKEFKRKTVNPNLELIFLEKENNNH